MNNNEQPKDLFDWAESQKLNQAPEKPAPSFTKAHPDDELGWNCPQCELNNGWCDRHPRDFNSLNVIGFENVEHTIPENEKVPDEVLLEDIEHEAMIAEANDLSRPATPEEIKKFFEQMKNAS